MVFLLPGVEYNAQVLDGMVEADSDMMGHGALQDYNLLVGQFDIMFQVDMDVEGCKHSHGLHYIQLQACALALEVYIRVQVHGMRALVYVVRVENILVQARDMMALAYVAREEHTRVQVYILVGEHILVLDDIQ